MLGLGFPISSSGKQKLNACSLTKSGLVGFDDRMSLIVWSCNFLKAQRYAVVDNILHQDNRSAILLKKMVRCLVASIPSTSPFTISLSQIGSGLKKSVLNGAPRVK
jgi:hypothetical protein